MWRLLHVEYLEPLILRLAVAHIKVGPIALGRVARVTLGVNVVAVAPVESYDLPEVWQRMRCGEVDAVHRTREESPNDQKLSDRSPGARVCAERREAKARHVPGFVAGAHDVTEPVEVRAALR